MKLHNCPLGSTDKELVSRYLRGLPFEELLFIIGDVQSKLTATEQITYDINRFCSSYADTEGRITLLLTLIDDAIVSPLCIPLTYTGNPESIDPARQKSYDFFAPFVKKEAARSEVALTDDIEAAPTAKVEIANPRWEPLEEADATGDPEIPLLGDTVRLLADVKNYPDGASVTFDVYDVTESTPLRIATVSGKNSGGKASAEWKVEDPQKRGDALKLQFEAGAKSKYTEKADLPWEDKLKCDFVEMPDVLFHHNSAVPCLDEGGMLLGALTATATFTKENSGKEIVIFGHTDTSGDPAYNFDLSQWRSEGIKALLDNDKDAWLDVVDLASKVEDYQAILKALSTAHGWECDPGKVDNVAGAKTTAAIKSFQDEYNSRFSGTLKVDGVIGPKTWVAIFETVHALMIDAVKEATGEAALPPFPYGYEGSGIYPCGESFPVDSAEKDGYKSATNRRVEIVFYDKGKAPKLTKPADKKKVEKKENPVYDKKKVEKKPVEVKPAEPVGGDNIVLDIVFPQINDATKPHKQYVNLSSNGKNEGVELTIKVKPKDLKATTAGKKVFWKITADANNSKRTEPKTGVMEKTGAALVEFAAGVAKIETPFNGNESSVLLACGVAGGDRFTVDIGTDGKNYTKTFVVENWRKFWYQLTHEKGLALPSFAITDQAWANMFVEIKKGNTKEFEKTDCLALEKQNIHTFYNEYVINPGGSDKEVAVMGSHNSKFFHKMYTVDPKQSPKVHFIVCQHQWDEGSILKQFVTEKLESKISGEINLNGQVFYPCLKGDLFYKGTWKSLATKGHKDFGKNGVLTNEWVLLEKNRSSRSVIKIKIPDTLGLTPDNKAPIEITFKLNTVLGPYLGESAGHQILAVSDPKDPNDFNNTLTHEAAHSFNQVPEPGAIPPGLGNHSNQYTGCGGIGSHCNTISDKNKEGKAGNLNKDGEYSTGVCVMYHAGDASCINKFCSVCEPFVKAADFSGFRKV